MVIARLFADRGKAGLFGAVEFTHRFFTAARQESRAPGIPQSLLLKG
jgi:hypothetical protein